MSITSLLFGACGKKGRSHIHRPCFCLCLPMRVRVKVRADLDVEEIVTRSLMEAEQVVVEIRERKGEVAKG